MPLQSIIRSKGLKTVSDEDCLMNSFVLTSDGNQTVEIVQRKC